MGLHWVARLRLLPIYLGKGREEGEGEAEGEGEVEGEEDRDGAVSSSEDQYCDVDAILRALKVREILYIATCIYNSVLFLVLFWIKS